MWWDFHFFLLFWWPPPLYKAIVAIVYHLPCDRFGIAITVIDMSTSSGNGLPHVNDDVEAGRHSKEYDDLDNHLDSDAGPSDPFDIAHTKNAPHDTLKRWRQAALVLNASRRFRYTLDLKKDEEKEQRKRTIRAHAQVIRASLLFKLAGENQIVSGPQVTSPVPGGDYAIGLEQLASMTRDHKLSTLKEYGGVKGLSSLLRTNLENGINEDEADMSNRRNAFGSNTYPRKKGRSFWMFLWEAWQDLTLIILIIAASVSLGLGIKTEEFFTAAIDEMASKSLRCVALSYRLCEKEKVPSNEDSLNDWVLPDDNLVLLAIVGIKDPCRPGVKDAVKKCMDAGVKVRMVTGDNIHTAKAIALECGILSSAQDVTESTIIEGRVFRALPEKEREQMAKKITVMGRSSPNDKLLLVQALRKGGDVVAVTGDGTNDAPALHEADIGLSMGIQGTEVAKESSDVIILDDNFASVVKVVCWGRSVYANIQKFIQFQLTVNVAALVINVVAAISSGDVPLNSVQLLWVNLIMDTLGALALATEPPTDNLMHRSPVCRREPLITNIMWRNLLIQALYQIAVLLVLNFSGLTVLQLEDDGNREHAYKVKNSLIFNAFVMCQIFNEFNARKPEEFNCFKGVTKNYLFMGIIGFTFILQIIIIEFLGKFTDTVRLDWQLWLVSLGIGIISWPLAIVGKMIPVPRTPVATYFIKPFRQCRKPMDA